MSSRKNFAQGRFYPDDPQEIEKIFEDAVRNEKIDDLDGVKEIIGGVAPHAGYVYCARVGVHLFEAIRRGGEKYDTVILLNPNHTGYGEGIEGDENEFWGTPLGEVETDRELLERIGIKKGVMGQKFEHSGEVLLPYLQHFIAGKFRLLPICVRDYRYNTAKKLAKDIYDAVKESGKRVLIIASSDFTHFKTREHGAELDNYALEAIMKLDSKEFYSRIVERDISICGLGPIMVLMEYMKLISKGAEMRILAKGDSGEVTGDSEVVDYVSLVGIDS